MNFSDSMRIRAVLVLTIGFFIGITALIFHLIALFGKRWIVAIPRNPRGLNDHIRYYGLWTRCQYSNTSFVIPDISSQPNIENFVCRPNKYLRYDRTNRQIREICYESRHQCSSIIGVHPSCQCQYLILTQIQQWCSIFAAIFLIFGILILYLKLIASPQNASARFLLTFVPALFFGLALISMLITMILLGAYLRRNEYEDYDIRLSNDIRNTLSTPPNTFNLYRLKGFFQNHPDSNLYEKVLSIFRSKHNERFHARIDWSAGAEIIAILLTFIAHLLSIILAVRRLN